MGTHLSYEASPALQDDTVLPASCTQVNSPCLNPSQVDWYVIYLPTLEDIRLSLSV